MVTLLLTFSFLTGLAAGSFANVIIHRVPRRESIVFPGSHCPLCGEPIPWYLNLPVLSYLLLRGHCTRCKGPISARYPLVEALMAALFLACAWIWGFKVDTLASCLFCLLCVSLGVIDLEHQLLPDRLTYPGILMGLGFCPFVSWTTWQSSLVGAAAGASFPALLILVYALFKIEAMGWGDVKFLAMVGAFLGWKSLLLCLLWGAIAGSLIGGIYLLATGKGRRTPLPFGTFLAAAAVAALFWGPAVWEWYMKLVLPQQT